MLLFGTGGALGMGGLLLGEGRGLNITSTDCCPAQACSIGRYWCIEVFLHYPM